MFVTLRALAELGPAHDGLIARRAIMRSAAANVTIGSGVDPPEAGRSRSDEHRGLLITCGWNRRGTSELAVAGRRAGLRR